MKRRAIAAAVLAVTGTPASAAPATVSPAVVQQLERKLDDMASQLEALKAELKAVKDQNATMATQQQAQARQQADQTAQVQQLQASQETLQQVAAKPSPLDNLSVFGYGEINYSRPSRNTNDTRADIGRAVFGFGYRFDDKTRFASEFEVEHAIASSSDRGEFEVEQFYIDHMFTNKVGMTAGVFLMPVGLINEHHEPTAYYGVYRNFIETLIIPSTWREGGFALHGNTDFGLDWNLGLTTGLDLSKWNFTPETPLYSSALDLQINGVAPMQATHQEMSVANAKNAAQYISLNYRGVSSLLLGGSVFTGNANPAAGAGSQRSTLWETHARWNPGKWDLSALYAQGSISNTAPGQRAVPGNGQPDACLLLWLVPAGRLQRVAARQLSCGAVRALRALQHGREIRGHLPGFLGHTEPAGHGNRRGLPQALRYRVDRRPEFLPEPERRVQDRLPALPHQS